MRFIHRTKILETWNGQTLRTARGGSAGGHFESSENPKNLKKIGKNKERDVRRKPNRWNVKKEKWKKNSKKKKKEKRGVLELT